LTERSPAELTLARHLACAVEDLLTVAPIELAVTESMGYCCDDPARRGPHSGYSLRQGHHRISPARDTRFGSSKDACVLARLCNNRT
jgi:hypothetical protein